jgi:hypothetical protein
MSSTADLFVLEYGLSSHFRSDKKRIDRLNKLFDRVFQDFTSTCDDIMEENKCLYNNSRSFHEIVGDVLDSLAVEIELFDIITNGRYMESYIKDDTETCEQLVENIGKKPYQALIRYFEGIFKYKYA